MQRELDKTAKSPDQKFWMDCKKDKIGNFERGCSQSNHRKVTDFGLLQDFKRQHHGSRQSRKLSRESKFLFQLFAGIIQQSAFIEQIEDCIAYPDQVGGRDRMEELFAGKTDLFRKRRTMSPFQHGAEFI